ncbi:PASTA domain-containing protein [Chitinivibrio alkaliphilus]|uniref:PASTA domain-containing protein n=1 Tax=Chitinivibrio alkaliphilus ACht1 TaxID=1313304 RepID=U7DBM6_9BACT|nr:PASTA domain-containing protein [Chitinivibrio alkaliphilus]ERP38983.1 hypothetical protein CALK_0473 [Chitinivibrio alkaliphilus ACht1]
MKRYYKFEISRMKFWTVVVPSFIGLCLVAVALSYYLINSVIMPRHIDLSARNIVEVPSLEGMSFADARQECYNLGLRLTVSAQEYNDTIPQNVVMRHTPEEGEQVKRGRVLSATVSRGSEIGTVPEIANLPFGPARTELHSAGFRNITRESVYSDEINQGRVVSVTPESGLQVSKEQSITVAISKGARASSATMPNVVGEMFSTARDEIVSRGLEIGSVEYEVVQDRRPGIVLRQSVSPNRSVDLNTKVDLVVTVTE